MKTLNEDLTGGNSFTFTAGMITNSPLAQLKFQRQLAQDRIAELDVIIAKLENNPELEQVLTALSKEGFFK